MADEAAPAAPAAEPAAAPATTEGADADPEQDKAATMLQSQARRKAATKRVEAIKAEKAAGADGEAAAAPAEGDAAPAAEGEAAATAPADGADPEQDKAATMLQSQARRKAATKRVEAIKAEKAATAEGGEAAAAAPAEGGDAAAAAPAEGDAAADPEQDKAATMLQSQARRKAATKRVEAIKAEKAAAAEGGEGATPAPEGDAPVVAGSGVKAARALAENGAAETNGDAAAAEAPAATA